MKAYRICNIAEYNVITNEHSLVHVGGLYEINSVLNNHNYKNDVRYMHFFGRIIDIGYWISEEGRYLCTYDIPDELLESHKGIGRYPCYQEFYELTEYAIPSSLVDYSYLKQIQHIDDTITFDDLVNNTYRRKLTTVYQNNGPSLFRKIRGYE